MDFRELNKIVVPQSQPFPLIEDLMVKTVNSKYFTTLDINSAFWSIPLRIQDRHKIAIITQEGHFQWTCLPFGLKTAPAIFQRILSNIIRKYKLADFAVNFIDDIIVFSRTFEEHITHLSKLLEAISTEGFRLKFSKCTFANKGSRRQVSLLKRKQMSPTLSNSFQRRTKVSQSSEFGHSSCKIARSFTACEVTVRILYYFPFCDFNVVLSKKCLENDV